ncbi:hypothetical protein XIS1_610049 [Xenorhabdus innexi]|uniref:Uncharacterized protein n=1 Tax=Xenorhabdus innexi TaxID=290109 RepID=A0A1N6MZW0_9GAMM|nr:hypothetical protein XIS1_610049 [Xenorhabdus innexi]
MQFIHEVISIYSSSIKSILANGFHSNKLILVNFLFSLLSVAAIISLQLI